MGLALQDAGSATDWILPFTSGGFIYIALVSLVPDMLRTPVARTWHNDLVFICAGISVVGAFAVLE